MIEDEMVGWHHQLNGHEFEQALGDSEGQEAWHAAVHGVAESDVTWQLNNNNTNLGIVCAISITNTTGILIEIALNLQIALDSVDILTILILPTHEHRIYISIYLRPFHFFSLMSYSFSVQVFNLLG